MSQENVEIVRRGYEVFERGDIQAILGLMDPEIEARFDPSMPDPEPRYGHDGFVSWLQSWLEPWERYRIEVDELIDVGERVIAVCREFGRRKDSGFEVEQPTYHVWTLKGGKAVRLDATYERAYALEAAGLSEQDAHADS
jgi:ketosteroid isomerase-like protein